MSRAAAAVARHMLALTDGRITGFAAPAGGPSPCLLQLEADDEPLAIARATRHSAQAAQRGVRLGWCGVVLDGCDVAAALSDRIVVRCAVSGETLLEANAPPPRPPSTTSLSVFDILAHARRDDACDNPASLLPFAEAALDRGGIAEMLAGTYRTLLGRMPEPELVAIWQAAPPASAAYAAFRMVLTSPEYLGDPRRFVPGPFHPAFGFDLGTLDG